MPAAGRGGLSPPPVLAGHITLRRVTQRRPARAAGAARATPPTAQPDGERVIEVRTMAPGPAAGYLGEHDQALADVLRLADAMGLIRPAA